MTTADLWALVHAERTRVVALLEGLDEAQWSAPTLCDQWDVEQVTAHLSAAARTGRWAWIRSIVAAGFDPARHNARRLAEQRGPTPQATLATFRASVPLQVAPTGDVAAFLGEVVVHGQDIARGLGIDLVPAPAAVEAVLAFYVAKDFAVNSRTLAKGLRLVATDSTFTHGVGPVVEGRAVDLLMALAGRAQALTSLTGDGVEVLGSRLA